MVCTVSSNMLQALHLCLDNCIMDYKKIRSTEFLNTLMHCIKIIKIHSCSIRNFI